MDAAALIVPTIASLALGGALLVPIRDSRKGRRATLSGRRPLTLDFDALANDSPSGRLAQAGIVAPPISALVTVTQANVVNVEPPRYPDADSRLRPKALEALATLKTFVENLCAKVVARRELASTPADADAFQDIVVERSFAEALTALLPIAPNSNECLDPMAAPPMTLADEKTVERSSEPQVTTSLSHIERVVPLTRLPLRYTSGAISWPASASAPMTFPDDTARYAFLRSAARLRCVENDSLLARAFREETPIGRTLALVALSRTTGSREAIETFVTALATGTDEERAIAVDALADAGAREDLARALSDRVEAIAARAALAYVGSTAREAYRTALAPIVDDARIESILSILAGVVE